MNAINTWTELLLNAGGKSVWIMGVLALGMVAWRRNAAATRHFFWLAGMLSLLLLPLTAIIPRPWTPPAWTQRADFMSIWLDNLELGSASAGQAPTGATQLRQGGVNRTAKGPGKGREIKSTGFWPVRPLRTIVFVAWSLGVGLMLMRWAARLIALRKLERDSSQWNEPPYTQELEAQEAALGVRRKVRLLRSRQAVMPMTWGWWRPVVLLPNDAGKWEPERLRLVLRHELAHVKRWDCLTQGLAHLACALYWFNPLVWLAARQMRVERERACDDLVLSAGSRPSDYAQHLLGIAQAFALVPRVAAIPMAKPSTLEHRLRAILDDRRLHGRLHPALALAVVVIAGALVISLGGFRSRATAQESKNSDSLHEQQLARMKEFSIAKEKQSRVLAAKAGEQFLPDYQHLFDAATNGDWQVVTNLYENFKRRHAQYRSDEARTNELPHTSYWSPVLEICLAYWEIVNGDPKYTQMFADDTINSIPPGSIYFGGTDPGRGLITAFCKSQAEADPFFTLTQNALADGSYLDYLRATYGAKIYVPTADDSQKCFNDYLQDAQQRLKEKKLKPGEDVKEVDGRVQVTGQVAVMSINALLAKMIFDKNPDREFYIEESFPLEWMFPHLEPHGPIMKINREPLPEISEEALQRDHQYWQDRVGEMLGNWFTDQSSVQTVADFAEKTWLRHDLSGFSGNPRFIANDVPQKIFSKLRSSIGGIYAWRLGMSPNGGAVPEQYLPKTPAEKDRMGHEADFAFKQAWALCPYSPEAVFRYINFLINTDRKADALVVAQSAADFDTARGGIKGVQPQFRDAVEQLKKSLKP